MIASAARVRRRRRCARRRVYFEKQQPARRARARDQVRQLNVVVRIEPRCKYHNKRLSPPPPPRASFTPSRVPSRLVPFSRVGRVLVVRDPTPPTRRLASSPWFARGSARVARGVRVVVDASSSSAFLLLLSSSYSSYDTSSLSEQEPEPSESSDHLYAEELDPESESESQSESEESEESSSESESEV